MKYISSTILSLTLLVVLGAGCGQSVVEKSIEKSIEKESGKNVDINSDRNSMTIEDEETGASLSAGEDVDFPSDFPSDIPKYEEGTVKMVTQNLGMNQSGYMIETSDDMDDIVAWFKGELEGDWQLKNTMTIQDSTIMMYEQSEGEKTVMLSVTVSTSEDDDSLTNIVVSRSER
jgi:hypothetical protein